jgi:hypothetical protein
MTEQKATAENQTAILKELRMKMAEHYRGTGQYDKAAKYLGMLLVETEGNERENVLAVLVEVELRAGWFSSVAELVANRLLEKDLTPDDAVSQVISGFLADSANSAEAKALLEVLGSIKTTQERPIWASELENWHTRFGSLETDKEPNKPAHPETEW